MLELAIGDQKCTIERQRLNKVIRCYECQKFGHIGKNCKEGERCVVCAGHHKSNFGCNLPKKCSNCKGEHTASDIKCPEFIRRNEVVTK